MVLRIVLCPRVYRDCYIVSLGDLYRVSLDFCFSSSLLVVFGVEPTTWLYKNSHNWTIDVYSVSQGSLNITPYSAYAALYSSMG